MTLFAGTYTVTAEAHLYGYYPTVVTQVTVVTDTVTPLDLPLIPFHVTLSPARQRCRNRRSLSATISSTVCPEGQCHGNTSFTVNSDPLTGYYSVTLISGTYTLRVQSEGYRPVVRTVNVNRDQTQDFPMLLQAATARR